MQNVRGVIFDIDGVLTFQGRVYPGAVEVVEGLRERGMGLCFLTNSTLKSRASCAEKLRKAGFRINDEEVITASYATGVFMRSLKPRSCWVMVDREGMDEFWGIPHDVENPEYVIVGDNRSKFDFDHLNHALRLLLKGAKLVAMQSELLDTSMGDIELNVGSWVGMLERAAGVKALSIGKPSSFVFELALRTMGLDKSEVVVVGDRISTDVRGAIDCGMLSVLVKTGEFEENDLKGDILPDFVFDSVRDLVKLF